MGAWRRAHDDQTAADRSGGRKGRTEIDHAYTVGEIAAFLTQRLPVDGGDDVPVVVSVVRRPIRRLGLALEPPPPEWVEELDAVFLHRPFRRGPDALRAVTVFASHRGFDQHLTTGFNPALADALHLTDLTVVEEAGKPIGMRGRAAQSLSWRAWEARLRAEFGVVEASLPHGIAQVRTVAVMNAMRAPLMEAAAAAGIDCYVTGQMRVPGRAPAARLGVGVIALGHARIEQWGLRCLARELAAAFPGLDTRVLDADSG